MWADQASCHHGRMAVRCLIVDDSSRFIEAARGLLDGGTVAVVGAATTADEALRKVDELRPDVVLLDIDLGPESGFEVARRLRERAESERVGSGGGGGPRIILISAHARADYEDLIAAGPVVGFMGKLELSPAAISEMIASDPGG
ncbi:LytR/AlgR family response regulator transcription factor [Actinomadura viridis]|uniref:LytR/AlgR family response regulator transcription factor n=1 Tax=Actinomadura viridis TaxID=58110 RepID=UPI0036989527